MARQTPEERRDEIRRDAKDRQGRESFQSQALRNLRDPKRLASDQNTRLRERDADIAEALATATRVVSHQVPKGADASDMLGLTFGNDKKGLAQTLGQEALRIYADNVANAQGRFAGGIKPSQVIEWSRQIDRDRANKQIFLAMPFKRSGDTVRYVTNAGPDSKDVRHFVTVEFLGYTGQLTGGRDKGITAIKNNICGGGIRFTCDCGRHRYYYNYLAGLGNYQLGQKETRYPHINNPMLGGLACKHALRVMHLILSASGAQYLLNEVKKDRARMDTNKGGTSTTTTAQLNAEFERQGQQAHHRRNEVLTEQQRPGYQERLKRQAEKMQKAALAAAAKQAAKDAARMTKAQMIASVKAKIQGGIPLNAEEKAIAMAAMAALEQTGR